MKTQGTMIIDCKDCGLKDVEGLVILIEGREVLSCARCGSLETENPRPLWSARRSQFIESIKKYNKEHKQ